MASDALEEKINKIRLQNEEIRRRHEEVEADKKNAAKLNALVQLVPSDNWPERKEPPEFSSPPKNIQKQKNIGKDHSDRPSQHYPGIQERLGKKDYKFAEGEGPPPDPKYNFLADSEREMRGAEDVKSDEDKNKSKNKTPRGGLRKRGNGGGGAGGGGGGSREAFFKDNRGPNAFHSKEESLPEYEAWRAERNRIDEARIKRQKTAEGNWRREWDSNKTSVDKEPFKKGDSNRKDYERRNNYYNNDYSNRGHGGGGSRTYHGSQKNHGQQDHRRPHHETHEFKRDTKAVCSPTDDKSIGAIDKSIKVTVNQTKGPVMSVKVNSPSIAGTGRVGPRQKSRVTYSSQSDAEMSAHEVSNFSRQKSFDEKTAAASFNNGQKAPPKSPFAQRKKDGNAKSPFPQRKEYKNDESSGRPNKNPKAPRNEGRDQKQSNNNASKPQRIQKRSQKPATDISETASASDNAIPSEYNPEKSLNSVDSEEPQIYETNSASTADENNVSDLTLQGAIENLNDSVETTEQNTCVSNENTVADNSENAEITKNIETDNSTEHLENEYIQTNDQIEKEEINSEISNAPEEMKSEISNAPEEMKSEISNAPEEIKSEIANAPENIKSEISNAPENIKSEISNAPEEIKSEISNTNKDIKDEISDANEKIKNKEIECDNKEKSIEPELQTNEIVNENNGTSATSEDNSEVVQDITDEVKNVIVSDNIEKIIINDQKSDELTETNTSESPEQTNVVSKIESDITSATNVTDNSIELEKLDNKNQDDNIVDDNLNDESIELDKTKANEEIDNPQNISVNDSGFIDDSDNLNNSLTIESSKGNNEKNSQESDNSDSEVLTKEICEKTEICDIRCAASSEIPQAVEQHVEKNEKISKLGKALEDLIKDCEVDIERDFIESSETSKIIDIQTVTDNEKAVEENAVKEKSTTIATDESKKD